MMSFLKNTTESVTTDLSTNFDPIAQIPEEFEVYFLIQTTFKHFFLNVFLDFAEYEFNSNANQDCQR